MSFTNMVLGQHWGLGEWPEHVDVSHTGKHDYKRYVPERTCHMDMTEEGEGRYRMWECCECGHSCEDVFGSYEYCPHCGARVVDE